MDFFDFASNTNIKVLSFLKAHPNSNFNDILARGFYQMSDLQNELIFLQKQNLIQTNPHLNPEFDEWAKTPVITVSLSSKGIAYLDAFEREEQWRKEQIEPIKEIAESANEQAASAKDQA